MTFDEGWDKAGYDIFVTSLTLGNSETSLVAIDGGAIRPRGEQLRHHVGQAEMRERAAMETWEWDDRDEIRKEIRALPLEGDDE